MQAYAGGFLNHNSIHLIWMKKGKSSISFGRLRGSTNRFKESMSLKGTPPDMFCEKKSSGAGELETANFLNDGDFTQGA